MDKYGYILKQNTEKRQADKRYHKSDLMLMTTFQLREICRREKIIHGIINPMDKENSYEPYCGSGEPTNIS